MEIGALNKPIGRWCPHCKIGAGCTIYEARPDECREFACVWLLDPSMPHKMRPDQTKVVLFLDTGGSRLVARCDASNPLAWRREPVYSALKRWAEDAFGQGGQVVAAAGNRLWVIGPNNDVDLGEIDPDTPVRIEEMPDGTVEVTVLKPSKDPPVFQATLKPRT
jgi:hypothetical protein